jgi:hypothetical protein
MYINGLGHTPGQTEAFITYIIHTQINKEINNYYKLNGRVVYLSDSNKNTMHISI